MSSMYASTFDACASSSEPRVGTTSANCLITSALPASRRLSVSLSYASFARRNNCS
ncbi:Uncharacterised protein [Mycobacteroides abscessus subsp. abscessus]|nr:Uncharacterised protein [Mycobacteroides abscessus subsp. abscessus]